MIDDREYWIRIPFPPSLNTRIGTKYTPKEYKAMHHLAARIAYSISNGVPLAGSLETTIYLQKDSARSFDIKNFEKAQDDGFTEGGLWRDDSQIDIAHQVRLPFVRIHGEWAYYHIKQIAPQTMIESQVAEEERIKKEAKEEKIRQKASTNPSKRVS